MVEELRSRGIGGTVYYPIPIRRLPYYTKLGYGKEKYPNAEIAYSSVIAFPTHPYVSREDIELIASCVSKLSRKLGGEL